jgi:excisionase family DNA binding protein
MITRNPASNLGGRHLTTQEVADRYQVSPATVRRMAKEGRLPEVRIGYRTIRYPEDQLEAAFASTTPTDFDGWEDASEVVQRVMKTFGRTSANSCAR